MTIFEEHARGGRAVRELVSAIEHLRAEDEPRSKYEEKRDLALKELSLFSPEIRVYVHRDRVFLYTSLDTRDIPQGLYYAASYIEQVRPGSVAILRNKLGNKEPPETSTEHDKAAFPWTWEG